DGIRHDARSGEARGGAPLLVHAAHGRLASHRNLARSTGAVHGEARRRRADRDRRSRRACDSRVARQAQRRAGEADATREALASATMPATVFTPEALFDFSVRVFRHFGVPDADAHTAATVLQSADP